ncbi:transposase [Kitasatospora sp. NBC_00085]|uniref:hypothetical protein n=1 Tax=unclassified Kitasatospora TaxID=2633591 RepID=UPI00324C7218
MHREIDEGLRVVENRNSANKDLVHGKDGDLTGEARESMEESAGGPDDDVAILAPEPVHA